MTRAGFLLDWTRSRKDRCTTGSRERRTGKTLQERKQAARRGRRAARRKVFVSRRQGGARWVPHTGSRAPAAVTRIYRVRRWHRAMKVWEPLAEILQKAAYLTIARNCQGSLPRPLGEVTRDGPKRRHGRTEIFESASRFKECYQRNWHPCEKLVTQTFIENRNQDGNLLSVSNTTGASPSQKNWTILR